MIDPRRLLDPSAASRSSIDSKLCHSVGIASNGSLTLIKLPSVPSIMKPCTKVANRAASLGRPSPSSRRSQRYTSKLRYRLLPGSSLSSICPPTRTRSRIAPLRTRYCSTSPATSTQTHLDPRLRESPPMPSIRPLRCRSECALAKPWPLATGPALTRRLQGSRRVLLQPQQLPHCK
jgi:hypothetical protein